MPYPNVIQPETRKPVVPIREPQYASPPVPLIGLAGVYHQWIQLHDKPLFGTFVDYPTWVLVPDNWKTCYPPWQVDMLDKAYIHPTYIREMRLVEVDSEAFKQLCFDKDRKNMARYLSYYAKDPHTRKVFLNYWLKTWEIPYE